MSNTRQNHVPVADLLTPPNPPQPSTSRGRGRGRGRNRPPPNSPAPTPPPRRRTFLGSLNPFSGDVDPNYEPSEEEQDEDQSVASTSRSTRSAPEAPETPLTAPVQTSRYITSLQLEINRFNFLFFYLNIFVTMHKVYRQSF